MSSIEKNYNTIIIGGGIVGAGILRDLSLHGVHCMLAEKHEFASQTSSKSSKMLHGGIRYLENFDFKLIFEALHEKNLWLKLAPHLAKEECFFLPVYKHSKNPLWMLKIGLFIYDLLSGFENSPHRMATKEQTCEYLKGINPKDLKGAGVYYDAIVDDYKLTIENIKQACKLGPATSLEQMELIHFERINDNTIHCEFLHKKEVVKISCENLIFATGPFTDIVLQKQKSLKWSSKLIPSKGSHLWLKKDALSINGPMVITTQDNRVVFVIPHEEKILVGTTEEAIQGEYDFITPSSHEISYLLECLNEYFPSENISHEHIISSFAGIRPLVKEGETNDKGKTAREHKVFMPYSNLFVIVGGKLTTFRVMGQEVTRNIVIKNNLSYNPDLTKRALL